MQHSVECAKSRRRKEGDSLWRGSVKDKAAFGKKREACGVGRTVLDTGRVIGRSLEQTAKNVSKKIL